MKKHLIKTIALSSSLFMGAYLLANTNAIQAQQIDETEEMMEVASFEYTDEASSMNHILNTLFEENMSFDIYNEVETDHFGFKAYQVGHLTVETDLHLNQMGQQKGTVILYDDGCSAISNELQLTLNSNQPIDKLIKNTKYSFHVSFEQKDVTAPIIQLSEDSIELDYDASFNAEDYIESVIDNIDGELEYTVDNPVDTTNAGDYTVTYSATDKSGNTTTATLMVTVKEKPVYKAPNAGANTSGNIYAMINLINETRSAYGLAPYSLDLGGLGAAAQLRSIESMNYLGQVPFHTRPDGTSYKTALHEMGVSSTNAIEILTYAGSSPREGLNWWLNSSTHRKFILSRNHSTIGIGFYNGMWCGIVK